MTGAVPNNSVWTVTKEAQLAEAGKLRIPLHVVRNAPVTIAVTVGHASQSENGDVGIVTLLGPVGAVHAPWVIRMGDQQSPPASHFSFPAQVTAAGPANADNWACVVESLALGELDWQVTVTVGSPTLATASFDLDLLNELLETVMRAADVTVHLESVGPARNGSSTVHWSDAIRNVLSRDHWSFPLDDPTIFDDSVAFQVVLDSVPGSLTVLVSDLTGITATISFQGTLHGNAAISVPGGPESFHVVDVEVESMSVTATIGFDGAITATCKAVATVGNSEADQALDTSGMVRQGVVSSIASKYPSTPEHRAQVRGYMDAFFGRLLRLGRAQIESYRFSGNAIVVTYVPTPDVPPIVHNAPLAPSHAGAPS